jgi:hypothetical protein
MMIERMGHWGDIQQLVDCFLNSRFRIDCSCCPDLSELQPEIYLNMAQRGVVSGKADLLLIFPEVYEHNECTIHLSDTTKIPLLLSDMRWLTEPAGLDEMTPIPRLKPSRVIASDEVTLGSLQPAVTLMPGGSLSFENKFSRSLPSQHLLLGVSSEGCDTFEQSRGRWKKRGKGETQTFVFSTENKACSYTLTLKQGQNPDRPYTTQSSIQIQPHGHVKGQLQLGLSLRTGLRRLPLILRPDYRKDRLYMRWQDGGIALEMDSNWVLLEAHENIREVLFTRPITPEDSASSPLVVKINPGVVSP